MSNWTAARAGVNPCYHYITVHALFVSGDPKLEREEEIAGLVHRKPSFKLWVEGVDSFKISGHCILTKHKINKMLGQVKLTSRMWYLYEFICLLVMDRKYTWVLIDFILYDS